MKILYATQVATISELRRHPKLIIDGANGIPVAILNHNVVEAYLVPVELFEKIMKVITLMDNDKIENHVREEIKKLNKKLN